MVTFGFNFWSCHNKAKGIHHYTNKVDKQQLHMSPPCSGGKNGSSLSLHMVHRCWSRTLALIVKGIMIPRESYYTNSIKSIKGVGPLYAHNRYRYRYNWFENLCPMTHLKAPNGQKPLYFVNKPFSLCTQVAGQALVNIVVIFCCQFHILIARIVVFDMFLNCNWVEM